METVTGVFDFSSISEKYIRNDAKKNIFSRGVNKYPKISIITVTYNSASTLAETLRSVQSQDYPNIEHIVIDGNSQDETVRIIKSFPHIAKWVSEEDCGLYDAMNKGVQFATGDIIGILNSDDLYAHTKVLSRVAERFMNSEIDALYGDLHYVNALNTNKVIRVWKSGKFKRSNFVFGWMPPHPTFFVKKEVYRQVGHFNVSLRRSADYELMLRILVKHKFNADYLQEVLVKMRTGGVSNGSWTGRLKANFEDRMAWKMNNLRPYFFTLYLKPFRKLFQFVHTEQFSNVRLKLPQFF
jgi:glycosyltransferase